LPQHNIVHFAIAARAVDVRQITEATEWDDDIASITRMCELAPEPPAGHTGMTTA
jgi:hypothetical protein